MDEYLYDDLKHVEQTYTLFQVNMSFVFGVISGFSTCIMALIHLGIIN